MVRPNPTSNQQQPGPGSTRNANKDKTIPTVTGIPRPQGQAATGGTARQKPVASFTNGNGKRTFMTLDEDFDLLEFFNKRTRTLMQESGQEKRNPKNDKISKGSDSKDRNWLGGLDGPSIKKEMLNATEDHADVRYLFSLPACHTSKNPITPSLQPTETGNIKRAVEKDLAIEKIITDLACVTKAIGTGLPNEESIRSAIEGIKKTTNSIKGILEKQQMEAKVAEGFEAIKKHLNGLKDNESDVLIEKINACEMAIASNVDLTMLEINSMKDFIIDEKLLEKTAQMSVEKFEKGLEIWKEENKIHQNECAAKKVEIEKLRAEVDRLAKKNQELEEKNQVAAVTIVALSSERDSESSKAKTTAEDAEALRQKLGAMEEERSKWKAAAMESHSAASIKLIESLDHIKSGLRHDFQAGNALIKGAKLFDIDATTRFETTIKNLMEDNQKVERDRYEELLKVSKDNVLAHKELRGRKWSYSAGMSDREVFDEILKSPWAGPTIRTIRNLAKFAIVHDKGESLSHSVVYRNIVPYISGRGCTRAFEAFLDYSQPGNEYCLFAVLEKKDGEAVGAIFSRDCPDHEDREDCLVTRCQASADGQGKTYTVLNPEAC
ncbi:hypothetical protein LZ32DRAFT_673682 [Colletotrichum eremochloae]|nr:hypothetical protein LZ32DRAFT_673682 [Colletotrichum eremochloae]